VSESEASDQQQQLPQFEWMVWRTTFTDHLDDC
jgi:hypothetical protein